MPDFILDDRLVRLYRRGEGGTQTVRISEVGNRDVWEYQFRLSWGSHISLQQATAQTSVDGLVAAVLANGARREGARAGVATRSTALLLAQPRDAWLADIVPAVDRAIDALVQEFVDYPYLHRVTGGHVEAGIAIEVGLNAPRTHLPDDRAKLRANGVRAGYLIELQRGRPADDTNLAILFAQDPSIKTAYAHFDPQSDMSTVKMLADTRLSRYRRAA